MQWKRTVHSSYHKDQKEKAMCDKMFPKALEMFQRAIVRQIVICDESFSEYAI